VIFALDLHVHSAASGDTDADPRRLLERALELGLDGLAFTEHDSYAGSAFAAELRRRHGDRILVLRGVEISAAEGHCLVFGADTDRLRLGGAPVAELVRAVAAAGGVAVPAHPFRRGSGIGGLVRAIPGLGALEGCNGANLYDMNRLALETARAAGLAATGGSDAHRPEEVGSCRTLFAEPVTEENFVALLRAGAFTCEDVRRVSRAPLPGPLLP